MLRAAYVSAAVELLQEHAPRSLVGTVRDPADVAAIAAVERLSVGVGTDDALVLQRLVDDATDGWDPAAPVGDDELAPEHRLVRELVAVVTNGVHQRTLGERALAAALNVDGGAHPVTEDAALLRVAARAAATSFEQVEYYRVRYGERGSRFASSDSGWLVTLTSHRPETAMHHVSWLAGLLASRGMPSWLMELHLEQLVEGLRGARRPVGGLPTVLAQLRWRRRAHVPDELLDQADAWVLETVTHPPVERCGALLAAGVGDVLGGHVGDDAALVDWLTDPVRTSTEDAEALLAVRARVMGHAATAP